MVKKVAIIGLDCATPQLVFGSLKGRMPFVQSLLERGVYGPLRSCDPPITVPAWSCMFSGLDPGQLGVYGFRNRNGYGYGQIKIASSLDIKAPRLWDFAARAGLRSIVLGVPQTYPPRPLKGVMVAGFLTPSTRSDFTRPPGLKDRLAGLCGGEYLLDVEGFRTLEPAVLKERLWSMTRRRFKLAGALVEQEDWDLFAMVEMGPDRLHHGFWQHFDPDHPLHRPGNSHQNVIPDYYALLDELIEKLCHRLPKGCLLLIVSDHGAQAMQGSFALNQWLIEQGYLVLKKDLSSPVTLQNDLVDWSRTRAWGEGGYYGRIFFNIKGREPQGMLEPSKVPAFAAGLKAELEALAGPQGGLLGNQVLLPREIYSRVVGIPPDLMLYPGNLAWRASALVGGGVFGLENDTGPDGANHAQDGIFAAGVTGHEIAALGGRELKGRSLYDIAPSVLTWLGLEPPGLMRGSVIPLHTMA
jgi:predicted AlkP superfamily phosphohydrolase/phosphomutase